MPSCPQCGSQHPSGTCPLLESTTFDCRDDPLLAEVFDGVYRVEWRLSIGGMSRVYRGTHLPSGLPVAVKVLFPSSSQAYQAFVSSFEREVDATRRLRHPHIVEVYDAGITQRDERYLVMELLNGEDLAERLDRGTLSVEEVIDLADQVLIALGYAHAQGVVHRDLKPGNIWLCGPASLGRIHSKLVDFGVARLIDSTDFSKMLVGTPAYMAPEQIRGNADGRSDLYALAMTLYEALCGERPYSGSNVESLLVRALEMPPEPPRSYRPDLPEPLSAWLLRALEKEPDRRFASAEEMRASLLAYKEARALSSRYVSVQTRKTKPPLHDDIKELRWSTFVCAQGPVEERERFAHILQEAKAQLENVGDVLVGSFGRQIVYGDEARRAVSAALLGLSRRLSVSILSARLPSSDISGLSELLRPELGAEGEIRLDRETYLLVRGLFELRPMESGAYTVLGEKPFGAGLRGLMGTEPPLIGREREQKQLMLLAQKLMQGDAAEPVLLVGDAGLGKSRLKIEVRRALSATQQPFEYIEGRGAPALQGKPYSLVAGALRLGTLGGTSSPSQVSRAVLAFLQEVAQRSPLLLVLEDLQWADEASLALLPEIAGCPGVWLLGLARPEALPRLEGAFKKRIELWPFTRDELRAFTRELVGDEEALAEHLFEVSQGNPLLAEEALQALREAGALAHNGERWSVVGPLQAPSSVGAEWFLQAYLDALPSKEKELVKRASLFGPRFYAEALGHLGADLAALPGVVRRGLVVERVPSETPGAREFLFRHSGLREAAHALLLPEERASLHRELARWLTGQKSPDAASIARHLSAAGETEAAVSWFRRASEEALSERHFSVSLQHLAQALALPDLSAENSFSLLLSRQSLLSRLGQREAARADLDALAQLAQDDASRSQVRLLRARLLFDQGELEEAKRLLQEGITQARREQNDLVLCEHLLLYAQSEAADGRFSEALLLTTEARSLAEAHNHAHFVATSLQVAATSYQRLGDLYRAKIFLEQALVAARRIGERPLEARILCDLGALLYHIGRFASAEEHVSSSLTLATRFSLQEIIADARYFFARLLLQKNKQESARKFLEEARTASDTLHVRSRSAACRVALAISYCEAERVEDAIDAAAEALELAPEPWTWAGARVALSYAHAKRMSTAAANAHASAAIEEARSAAQEGHPSPLDEPEETLSLLAETLRRLGRPQEADQLLSEAKTFLQERAQLITDEATRYSYLHRPGLRRELLS